MSVVLDKASVRYFGERLSDNIARTPEGYLICKNAVIGRTGSQKYLAGELDDPDGLAGDHGPGDEIDVWRSADEVFSDPTISSFEGKTFTLRHPSNGKLLSPDDDQEHNYGHVQHVRKGSELLDTGDWPLLADIVVKGRRAIDAIENGDRELSCGYSYRLFKNGDKLEQRNIVGNHVALVESARAGKEARINDSAPRKETHVKNPLKHLFGLGLKEYSKNTEDPEQIATMVMDAMPAMTKEEGKAEPPESQLDDKRRAKDDDDDKRKAKDDDKKSARDADRRGRMHGALDKVLDAYEEKEQAGDVDLEALKQLFSQYFTEEEAEKEHQGGGDADKTELGKNKAETKEETEAGAEDAEEVKPLGEVKAADKKEEEEEAAEDDDDKAADDAEIVHPEPELEVKEKPQSQLDAAAIRKAQLAVLKQLRPAIARTTDKKLRAAFDAALREVKEPKGGNGSYAKFVAASQLSAAADQLKDSGMDQETPLQKQATSFDAMYKKAMKERLDKAGLARK